VETLKGIAGFMLACLLAGAILYLVFIGGAIVAAIALIILVVGGVVGAVYVFLQYLADRID
jgi:hypothetical protein